MVVAHPVRTTDGNWEVCVRLIDNDYSASLGDTESLAGTMTHFIGNAKPELHDVGYIKYQSKQILLPCVVIHK